MIHFDSNYVNTQKKVALKEGKNVRDIPIEGEWQPLGLALKTVGDRKRRQTSKSGSLRFGHKPIPDLCSILFLCLCKTLYKNKHTHTHTAVWFQTLYHIHLYVGAHSNGEEVLLQVPK